MNPRKKQILVALSALILAGLACISIRIDAPRYQPDPPSARSADEPPSDQSADGQSSAGDPDQGEVLFSGQGEQSFHCSVCHSLEPGETLVGPSLAGIASRAETLMEGVSAEEYLRESIVEPNAYVVEGFQPGIMPANFGNRISDQQLADLIAFLLTLK